MPKKTKPSIWAINKTLERVNQIEISHINKVPLTVHPEEPELKYNKLDDDNPEYFLMGEVLGYDRSFNLADIYGQTHAHFWGLFVPGMNIYPTTITARAKGEDPITIERIIIERPKTSLDPDLLEYEEVPFRIDKMYIREHPIVVQPGVFKTYLLIPSHNEDD